MHPRCLPLSRAALAAVLLAGLAPGAAPPARAPDAAQARRGYEGTWKVTLPNQRFDVTLWLVRIDKGAKKARVISGVGVYSKSKLSDLQAGAGELAFTLTAGSSEFRIAALPPAGKEKDQLLGSARLGSGVFPVWLQRTTLEELTEANAVRESAGFAELQAALKGTDPAKRLEAVRAVAAKHAGKPIHFLALQAVLGQLMSQKAEIAPFRETAEAYRKLAATHGTQMVIGANLDLANNLLRYPKAVPVAVESAQAAARAVRAGDPVGLKLSVQLALAACLQAAGKTGETKPVATEVDRLAAAYVQEAKGDEARLNAAWQMAVALLSSSAAAVADKGLTYARQAVKLLKPDAPPAQRANVYKLLARALESRGKADEARALRPTIDKLEAELDREYLKESIPFKVEKFPGRKGKSERVVLVELFTDSVLRPAVAGSIAFDAALQRYASKDVVFIQYHVAFPEPDPLVNPDSEARKAFYKADLEGLPALFADGKLTPPLGGARQRGKNSYDVARVQIDKALEVPPGAALKLEVSRKGDTLTATAKVSGLKETGAHVRLRFALVEERVRFGGANGVRLHQHLVRAFLGGADGFRLEKKASAVIATISLPQLKKSLEGYLDGLTKKAGTRWPERPLELARLKVVAFVQDEDSKRVFQSAQADVPGK
jgi:hypothetical protein